MHVVGEDNVAEAEDAKGDERFCGDESCKEGEKEADYKADRPDELGSVKPE
ncbi:MAG: hypothetical protein S4CHLAM102_05190 [Chlamydiia bacterium]|nr:hypothetical protein [Chlamydiia bacterium]